MLGLENLDTPFVENLTKALAIIHEIDSPWLSSTPTLATWSLPAITRPTSCPWPDTNCWAFTSRMSCRAIIRGVPFGEGIVPFRETFQALAQTGFWGLLGIEIWGDRHAGDDPVASVAAARRFVGNLVDETWPNGLPWRTSKTGATTCRSRLITTGGKESLNADAPFGKMSDVPLT